MPDVREVYESPTVFRQDESIGSLSALELMSDRLYTQATIGRPASPPDLPGLEIREAPPSANPPKVSKDIVLTNDVENAKSKLDRLADIAGVPRDKGLTADDLRRLETKNLTIDERRAVDFLVKNFDAVSTQRRKDNIDSWDPFSDPRIDKAALERNKADAVPTGLDQSPGRNARDPEPARDVVSQGGEQRPGRDRMNADDVVVQRNWGWERVARESLRMSGVQDANPQRVLREMHRLQALNPDKIDMLHPNDHIRRR